MTHRSRVTLPEPAQMVPNEDATCAMQSTGQSMPDGFICAHAAEGAAIHPVDARAYQGLGNHASVKRGMGECLREQPRTSEIESFVSMLEGACKGTFHKPSPKYLRRFVDRCAGGYDIRELDTVEELAVVTGGLVGRSLSYRKPARIDGLLAEAQG